MMQKQQNQSNLYNKMPITLTTMWYNQNQNLYSMFTKALSLRIPEQSNQTQLKQLLRNYIKTQSTLHQALQETNNKSKAAVTAHDLVLGDYSRQIQQMNTQINKVEPQIYKKKAEVSNKQQQNVILRQIVKIAVANFNKVLQELKTVTYSQQKYQIISYQNGQTIFQPLTIQNLQHQPSIRQLDRIRDQAYNKHKSFNQQLRCNADDLFTQRQRLKHQIETIIQNEATFKETALLYEQRQKTINYINTKQQKIEDLSIKVGQQEDELQQLNRTITKIKELIHKKTLGKQQKQYDRPTQSLESLKNEAGNNQSVDYLSNKKIILQHQDNKSFRAVLGLWFAILLISSMIF